jgi:hypothetical protein
MFWKILAVLLALSASGLGQMCVSQGEGSCQFVLSYAWAAESDIEFGAILYDHACNKFATAEDVGIGTTMQGGLDHPVTVTDCCFNSDGSEPAATIEHLGERYGAPDYGVVESCAEGLTACAWVRYPFNCPGH